MIHLRDEHDHRARSEAGGVRVIDDRRPRPEVVVGIRLLGRRNALISEDDAVVGGRQPPLRPEVRGRIGVVVAVVQVVVVELAVDEDRPLRVVLPVVRHREVILRAVLVLRVGSAGGVALGPAHQTARHTDSHHGERAGGQPRPPVSCI
jgi:hypothetical protein